MAMQVYDTDVGKVVAKLDVLPDKSVRLRPTKHGIRSGKYSKSDHGKVLRNLEAFGEYIGQPVAYTDRPLIETFRLDGIGELNITTAKQIAASGRFPVVPITLTREYVTHTLRRRGVSGGKAARLPDEALAVPGIALWMGDHMEIIDGNHRVVARWRRGFRDYSVVLLPSSVLPDIIML
ncbi:MAG: hypothetical protein HQL42_10870 [Alphaproteobacteria bacterium]|nr:hypothetical protein [Alphaproteobacteria bacterium]